MEFVLIGVGGASLLGIAHSVYNMKKISEIDVEKKLREVEQKEFSSSGSLDMPDPYRAYEIFQKYRYGHIDTVVKTIIQGANTFIKLEYKYLAIEILFTALLIFYFAEPEGGHRCCTTISFIVGAVSSIFSAYVGVRFSALANVRVAISCSEGLNKGFVASFRSSMVIAFAFVSICLITLTLLLLAFTYLFEVEDTETMLECFAGYSLGSSFVALLGRIGGGIFIKGADIGADLVGEIAEFEDEDNMVNPGDIADNAGDIIATTTAMASDLIASIAESTSAAMILAAYAADIVNTSGALYLPFLIIAGGIVVSIITSFYITCSNDVVKTEHDLVLALRYQLIISSCLMTPLIGLLAEMFVREKSIDVDGIEGYKRMYLAIAAIAGLWCGVLIALYTDYTTSHRYKPVQEIVTASETGVATNIFFGLALGFLSTVFPVLMLSGTIYIGFICGGSFGVVMSSVGMLSISPTILTLHCMRSLWDSACGVAKLSKLHAVYLRLQSVQSALISTASYGRGFSCCTAALVGLSLLAAFSHRLGIKEIDLLHPLEMPWLILGAMVPYLFSALIINSVNGAAHALATELRVQVDNRKFDCDACLRILSNASVNGAMLPVLIVVLTPLVCGCVFGPKALDMFLAGALLLSITQSISFTTSGVAWDNAKNYIEEGKFKREGIIKGINSKEHKAALVGDQIGDPLKDAAGPGLNILMKHMPNISLVFALMFTRITL